MGDFKNIKNTLKIAFLNKRYFFIKKVEISGVLYLISEKKELYLQIERKCVVKFR